VSDKAPPKAPCRCVVFCLEDLARTGRICKLHGVGKPPKKEDK